MKKTLKISLIILCEFIIIIQSCQVPKAKNKKFYGYNFDQSFEHLKLPKILHEISGITAIDSINFACIQDEIGVIFIFNSKRNEITKELPFHVEGDYEGIAKTDSSLFILRSDGVLFETRLSNDSASVVNIYETPIPADNNEGLCYDEANNRLLIACKGKVGKGKEFKDQRFIYAFDLQTRSLSDEPVIRLDVNELIAFAIDQGIVLDQKKKKSNANYVLKFRPSAIGIHPLNHKLFLLSAVDHMLFIFDENGKIEHIERLDEQTYNKAEGIAFFENGDLLITNEGQNKKPSIICLKYKL